MPTWGTTISCAPTGRAGWSDHGPHRNPAALCVCRAGAPRAAARLVPVRQARQRAEVRHALAGRDAGCAALAQLRLVGQRRRDRHRDLRRLFPRAGDRRRARARVHLVEGAGSILHAAAGVAQHDPESGARAAHHRLVQVRRVSEHPDGVLDLRLPDPAHHGARPARGGARAARPGALAQGFALAAVHQDPASRRAALHLLGHEGGRDPRGGRRRRRRIPRLRPGAGLPHAAGAGDARHARDVHGGHPHHAARHAALRGRAAAGTLAGGEGREARLTGEPFIHLAGVTKIYRRGRSEHPAISDATFDVMAGELVSLVGPSGCGKSTLLKILAGLHRHDGGELRIGTGAHSFDPARDVGMVFQAPLLLKWRRILENVLLPAEILGLPMAAARERARDLLALVGLTGNEDKYPYELSGGMQQRAAIARALVHDPKLVLMDEPFGALDALTREKMNLELLRIWKEAGKTIVFVTHGISEAVFLGTRVVVLTAGPARMADNFRIELPYPRTLDIKTHERFGEYTRRVYKLLGME
ncbi:MAG: ABC transporter ATP-binding protein [Betaproteobacteria bacterium]|nr:MAG: ABC transporter ATP-binding protein [Betaproteobacteria bacterium]